MANDDNLVELWPPKRRRVEPGSRGRHQRHRPEESALDKPTVRIDPAPTQGVPFYTYLPDLPSENPFLAGLSSQMTRQRTSLHLGYPPDGLINDPPIPARFYAPEYMIPQVNSVPVWGHGHGPPMRPEEDICATFEIPLETLMTRRCAVSHETQKDLFCPRSKYSQMEESPSGWKKEKQTEENRVKTGKSLHEMITEIEQMKNKIDGLRKCGSKSSQSTGESSSEKSSSRNILSWSNLKRKTSTQSTRTQTSNSRQNSNKTEKTTRRDKKLKGQKSDATQTKSRSTDSSGSNEEVYVSGRPRSYDASTGTDDLVEGARFPNSAEGVPIQESKKYVTFASDKSVPKENTEEQVKGKSPDLDKDIRRGKDTRSGLMEEKSTRSIPDTSTHNDVPASRFERTNEFALERRFEFTGQENASIGNSERMGQDDASAGKSERKRTNDVSTETSIPNNVLASRHEGTDKKFTLEGRFEITGQENVSIENSGKTGQDDAMTGKLEKNRQRNEFAERFEGPGNDNVSAGRLKEIAICQPEDKIGRINQENKLAVASEKNAEKQGVKDNSPKDRGKWEDTGTLENSVTCIVSSDSKPIRSFQLPFGVSAGSFQQNMFLLCTQDLLSSGPAKGESTELPKEEPVDKNHEQPKGNLVDKQAESREVVVDEATSKTPPQTQVPFPTSSKANIQNFQMSEITSHQVYRAPPDKAHAVNPRKKEENVGLEQETDSTLPVPKELAKGLSKALLNPKNELCRPEDQELCEVVLAVRQRDMPIRPAKESLQNGPTLRIHSREMCHDIITQWKHTCRNQDHFERREGSSSWRTGQEELSRWTPSQSSHRDLASEEKICYQNAETGKPNISIIREQTVLDDLLPNLKREIRTEQEEIVPKETALSLGNVSPSVQGSKHGVVRWKSSRKAVQEQPKLQKDESSTKVGIKYARFYGLYEKCQAELVRWKSSIAAKLSSTQIPDAVSRLECRVRSDNGHKPTETEARTQMHGQRLGNDPPKPILQEDDSREHVPRTSSQTDVLYAAQRIAAYKCCRDESNESITCSYIKQNIFAKVLTDVSLQDVPSPEIRDKPDDSFHQAANILQNVPIAHYEISRAPAEVMPIVSRRGVAETSTQVVHDVAAQVAPNVLSEVPTVTQSVYQVTPGVLKLEVSKSLQNASNVGRVEPNNVLYQAVRNETSTDGAHVACRPLQNVATITVPTSPTKALFQSSTLSAANISESIPNVTPIRAPRVQHVQDIPNDTTQLNSNVFFSSQPPGIPLSLPNPLGRKDFQIVPDISPSVIRVDPNVATQMITKDLSQAQRYVVQDRMNMSKSVHTEPINIVPTIKPLDVPGAHSQDQPNAPSIVNPNRWPPASTQTLHYSPKQIDLNASFNTLPNVSRETESQVFEYTSNVPTQAMTYKSFQNVQFEPKTSQLVTPYLPTPKGLSMPVQSVPVPHVSKHGSNPLSLSGPTIALQQESHRYSNIEGCVSGEVNPIILPKAVPQPTHTAPPQAVRPVSCKNLINIPLQMVPNGSPQSMTSGQIQAMSNIPPGAVSNVPWYSANVPALASGSNEAIRTSDISESSQLHTKSATDKSKSCYSKQPPPPVFQSLKNDLPGTYWTPFHIESRVPLSFFKGKNHQRRLQSNTDCIKDTKDGSGTPLRKASYRMWPHSANESTRSSAVGKKPYTSCYASKSSFQKNVPQVSQTSSPMSGNSSSLQCTSCNSTTGTSSDNSRRNANQITGRVNTKRQSHTGDFLDPIFVSKFNRPRTLNVLPTRNESLRGTFGSTADEDKPTTLPIPASLLFRHTRNNPFNTALLFTAHCLHKSQMYDDVASCNTGAHSNVGQSKQIRCSNELFETRVLPQRPRSEGEENRSKQYHRNAKTFSSSESLRFRGLSGTSSTSHTISTPAEDLSLRKRTTARFENEMETLRQRSPRRNYTACIIDPWVPSRKTSKAKSPPSTPAPFPVPTAFPTPTVFPPEPFPGPSVTPSFCTDARNWKTVYERASQTTSPEPMEEQNTTQIPVSDTTNLALPISAPSASSSSTPVVQPFQIQAAPTSSPPPEPLATIRSSPIHITIGTNPVPVPYAPCEHSQRATYEPPFTTPLPKQVAALPNLNITTTCMPRNETVFNELGLTDPVNPLSSSISSERRVSFTFSQPECDPLAFPEPPGRQPVSLVFIPVPTVIPLPSDIYPPYPETSDLQNAEAGGLFITLPAPEMVDECTIWQEVCEENVGEEISAEPEVPPLLHTPVFEENVQLVHTPLAFISQATGTDEQCWCETPLPAGMISAQSGCLRFLQLLAIAMALGVAMEVSMEFHEKKIIQTPLNYEDTTKSPKESGSGAPASATEVLTCKPVIIERIVTVRVPYDRTLEWDSRVLAPVEANSKGPPQINGNEKDTTNLTNYAEVPTSNVDTSDKDGTLEQKFRDFFPRRFLTTVQSETKSTNSPQITGTEKDTTEPMNYTEAPTPYVDTSEKDGTPKPTIAWYNGRFLVPVQPETNSTGPPQITATEKDTTEPTNYTDVPIPNVDTSDKDGTFEPTFGGFLPPRFFGPFQPETNSTNSPRITGTEKDTTEPTNYTDVPTPNVDTSEKDGTLKPTFTGVFPVPSENSDDLNANNQNSRSKDNVTNTFHKKENQNTTSSPPNTLDITGALNESEVTSEGVLSSSITGIESPEENQGGIKVSVLEDDQSTEMQKEKYSTALTEPVTEASATDTESLTPQSVEKTDVPSESPESEPTQHGTTSPGNTPEKVIYEQTDHHASLQRSTASVTEDITRENGSSPLQYNASSAVAPSTQSSSTFSKSGSQITSPRLQEGVSTILSGTSASIGSSKLHGKDESLSTPPVNSSRTEVVESGTGHAPILHTESVDRPTSAATLTASNAVSTETLAKISADSESSFGTTTNLILSQKEVDLATNSAKTFLPLRDSEEEGKDEFASASPEMQTSIGVTQPTDENETTKSSFNHNDTPFGEANLPSLSSVKPVHTDALSPDKIKLKKKSRFYVPKTGDINKHLDKKNKEIPVHEIDISFSEEDVERAAENDHVFLQKHQINPHFVSDAHHDKFHYEVINIPYEELLTDSGLNNGILYLTIFMITGYAALLMLQLFLTFNGGRNVWTCPFVIFGLTWFALSGAYFFYRGYIILGAALVFIAALFLTEALYIIILYALRRRRAQNIDG